MKLIDEETMREIDTRAEEFCVAGFESVSGTAFRVIKEFLANEKGMTYYVHRTPLVSKVDPGKPSFREIIINKMLEPYDDFDELDWEERVGDDGEYWLTDRYPTRDDLLRDAAAATDENLMWMYTWFVENQTVYG